MAMERKVQQVESAMHAQLRHQEVADGVQRVDHDTSGGGGGGGGKAGVETNVAVKLGLKKMPDIQVDEYYATFLNMAKNLMEGNIDSTTYEDTCREMFGVHAYVVFTIDRLVQNTVRQLHSMLSDDGYHVMEQFSIFVEQLLPLHCSYEQRLPLESAYQRKMEGILANENCFKIKFYKAGNKMTMELVDTDTSSDNIDPCSSSEVQRWLHYIHEYSKTDDIPLPELKDTLAKRKKLFLKRNRRVWPKQTHSHKSFGHVDEAKMIHANLPMMEIHGYIQFKMDKNAYRMIPLANSEDYLYNRGLLQRLRETNARSAAIKSTKFWKWHEHTWQHKMSTQEVLECDLWLTGASEEDKGYSTACTSEECLGQKRRRYVTTHFSPGVTE
jgi:paired amphipathic helix protein Sin3a